MRRNLKWWIRAGSIAASHPVLLSQSIWYGARRQVSDNLAAFGYYAHPHRIIFLAGMPMSATTWMKNLVARIPGYYTRPTPMPDEVADNQDICDAAFSHVPKHGYTLFKTHLNPNSENLACIRRNGVDKVLITYRDLRDVVVARYYRLIEFPRAGDAADFVDYRALGKEKAMDNSIEIVASEYVWWIREWMKIAKDDPGRYHLTQFENLKRDTVGEFKKVLIFYGIKLAEDEIGEIVDAARGKGTATVNINKSRILPWGYSSNFRSGRIGSWRDEFSENNMKKCKAVLGTALVELGYEKDSNW